MATMKQSIAGRAHGAKPAAVKPQTKRYRPQLEGLEGVHPEVARAIQTAFDNLYSLRDQVQALSSAGSAEAKGGGAAGSAESGGKKGTDGFNDNIQGLKIKATTDPSSIKDGYTIRWNASNGQFEFGV